MHFPSGVIIDGENNLINFPVGDSLILKFTFEEWMEFVGLVSDVNLVFESNTVVDTYSCGACGTINSTLEFQEPTDEELN
tara:strand:- start:1776 stop:2015 length:240 start_codon:yes stop_codon:yes gene_type:complete